MVLKSFNYSGIIPLFLNKLDVIKHTEAAILVAQNQDLIVDKIQYLI